MTYLDPILADAPAVQPREPAGMGEEERRRVGMRLRLARVALGLSQADVAERAGVLQKQVSLIERGQLNMTFDTLLRLSAALDLPMHELVKP